MVENCRIQKIAANQVCLLKGEAHENAKHNQTGIDKKGEVVLIKECQIKLPQKRILFLLSFLICYFLFCGTAAAGYYYLAAGESASFLNTGSTSCYITVNGACDRAMYFSDGSEGGKGKNNLNVTNVYISSKARVVITNTAFVGYFIEYPASVSPKEYSYSALKHYSLSPGKSLSYTNSSPGSCSIYVPGAYSHAGYQINGSSGVIGIDNDGAINEYTGKGERQVITNESSSSYTVYGAYEVFHPQGYDDTAVTRYSLQPGKSLSFKNSTPSSFYIRVPEAYSHAEYQTNGSSGSIGIDNDGSSYEYIFSGGRQVITNESSGSYTVYGAFETFKPEYYDKPALRRYSLGSGQSLSYENPTPSSFYICVPGVKGSYSYADYTSYGKNSSFGISDSSQHEYLSGGYRQVITNESSGSYTVYGAYEVFQPVPSQNPALKRIWVQPGKSITFTNKLAVTFNVWAGGACSSASYKSNGSYYDMKKDADGGYQYIAEGTRSVLTNDSSKAIQVYGAYEGV